jgi:outer membrane protein OmpA-like peptidoglycan-associated protein
MVSIRHHISQIKETAMNNKFVITKLKPVNIILISLLIFLVFTTSRAVAFESYLPENKVFYVNALRIGSISNEAVLEKISQNALSQISPETQNTTQIPTQTNLWFQAKYGQKQYDNTYIIKEKFNAYFSGLSLGYDILNNSGIFLSYDEIDISQKTIKAKGSDIQFGGYGSFAQQFTNIYATAFVARQTYIVRDEYFNNKTSFDSYSIRAAFDADFLPTKTVNPFIGMRGALVILANDVKENISDDQKLDHYEAAIIRPDNYARLETLAGLKMRFNVGDFIFSAKIYAASLLFGNEMEYADIRLNNESKFFAGANIGIAYEARQNINVFINMDSQASALTNAYNVMAGFNLKFGNFSDGKKFGGKKLREPKEKHISESKAIPVYIMSKQEIETDTSGTKNIQSLQDSADKQIIKSKIINNRLIIEDKFFSKNNRQLDKDAKDIIKEQIPEIKSMKYKKIVVIGYSDNKGSKDLQNLMSLSSAKLVAKELVNNGIDVNKIQYIGAGNKNSIASNATAIGRSKNRRVEVRIE